MGTAGDKRALARVTGGGSRDATFGVDGMVTTNVAGGACDAVGYALEVGPDGRVTVVGEANYSFGVARYLMPAGLEERLYAQQDANFNVTSIADVFGKVAERYEFLPYGERAVLTAGFVLKPGGSDFDFSRGHQGGQHDLITGLVNFRHREYSTALGRWVQQDPTGDGSNLYEYVSGTPVHAIDPMGLTRHIFAFEGLGGYSGTAAATLQPTLPATRPTSRPATMPGTQPTTAPSTRPTSFPTTQSTAFAGEPGKWADPHLLNHAIKDVVLTMQREAGGDTEWHYYAQDNISAAFQDAMRIAKEKIPGKATKCYHTIVVLGFSNGGDSAIDLAERLGRENIRVDLGYTIDPVPKLDELKLLIPGLGWSRPKNASTWYNFYQTDDLIQGRGVSGADLNVNLTRQLKTAYPRGGHFHRWGRIVEYLSNAQVNVQYSGHLNQALRAVPTSRAHYLDVV